MSSGIVHLEDLTVPEFIDTIRNLSKFTLTEKLDGAELVFGLDSRGNFYTSREVKNGDRYYSSDEYPEGFWTVAFKSAHKALESNIAVIKKFLTNGDAVEIEVLFGSQPNTIPYNSDTNFIAFLRPISGNPNIEALSKLLLNKKTTTSLNVPFTTNGINIKFRDEKHQWKFVSVPQFAAHQLEKLENNKNINTNLDKLESYLESKSGIGDFTNIEVLGMKLNKKPDNIGASVWSSIKQNVKDTKQDITNTVMSFKLKIKDELLNTLVRSAASKLGPTVEDGGWIEGVVLRNDDTNYQVKLVDKQIFTELNTFTHKTRKELQSDIWLRYKLDLAEAMGHPKLFGTTKKQYLETNPVITNLENVKTKVDSLSDKYIRLLKNKLTEYKKSYTNFKHDVNFGDRVSTFTYNNETHNRTLQAFASTLHRITDMRRNIICADSSNTIIEAFLETTTSSKKVLKEGGNIFKNTQRISIEDIPATLEYISKITGIPLDYISDSVLGSVGKSKTSGDIDIAVDSKKYNLDDLYHNIKKHLEDSEINHSKGLNVLSISVPICGDKNKGYVQTDLMLSDNIEWSKFNYFSAGDKSKYKGLYRRYLLSSIAGSMNDTKHDENGELIERIGWVWIPAIGLQKQRRYRPIGKNGERLKTFKVERTNLLIDDPKKVIKHLFGKDVDPKNLETVEDVVAAVKKYKTPEEQKLIFAIYKKSINNKGHRFPDELINNGR